MPFDLTNLQPPPDATIPSVQPPPDAASPPSTTVPETDPYRVLAHAINKSERPFGSPEKNPRSTATGNGQFLENTWLELMHKNHPELTAGKSAKQILDLRSDPELSTDMTQAYAVQNAKVLADAGFPITSGILYAAHVLGPQGAMSVLSANPNAPLSSLLHTDAMAANPSWNRYTGGNFLSVMHDRVNGNIPQATTDARAEMQLSPDAQSSRFMQPPALDKAADEAPTLSEDVKSSRFNPDQVIPNQVAEAPHETTLGSIAKNVQAGAEMGVEGLGNVVTDPVGSLIEKPVMTTYAFGHDLLSQIPALGMKAYTPEERTKLINNGIPIGDIPIGFGHHLGDLNPDSPMPSNAGTNIGNAALHAAGVQTPEEIPAQNALERGVRNTVAGAVGGAVGGPVGMGLGALGGGLSSGVSEVVPEWAQPMTQLAGNAVVPGMLAKRFMKSPEPNPFETPKAPISENYADMDVDKKVDALTTRLASTPTLGPDNTDYLGYARAPTLLERDPTPENLAKYQAVVKNDGDNIRGNHELLNETRIHAANDLNLESSLEYGINRGLMPGMDQFRGPLLDNPISEGRLTRLKGIRGAITSPLRSVALDYAGPADVQPVVDTINKMLAPPDQGGEGFASRPTIANPLNAVLGRLKNEDGTPVTNARQLYIVKQSIDDMLNKSVPENAANQTARKQLSQVKDAIDQQLADASPKVPQKTDTGAIGPGFNAYNEYVKAYHEFSHPINEINALRDAGFSNLQDSGTVVKLNNVKRVIANLVDDIQTNGVKSDANSVSNKTWSLLFNLRDDLARTENVVNQQTGALKPGLSIHSPTLVEKYQNNLGKGFTVKKGLAYGASSLAGIALPAIGSALAGVPGTLVGTGVDLAAGLAMPKIINSLNKLAKTKMVSKYSKELLTPEWTP